MTIIEMPRRARAAVRWSGNSLVARFFEPWFARSKPSESRQYRLSGSDRRIEVKLRPAVSASAQKPCPNAPLGSLAGGNLAGRFHAWWGASGQRYICTVFPVDAAEPDFGLPEFDAAIVLAVACEANGERQLLSLLPVEGALDQSALRRFIHANWEAGVGEWHVHLLTEDHRQRRAVAHDLQSRLIAAA